MLKSIPVCCRYAALFAMTFSLPAATANAFAFDVAGTLISNAPCTGCQQPTTCNAPPAWSRDHVSLRPTCCGVALSMTVCKTVRDIRLILHSEANPRIDLNQHRK